jgi:pimeloyl-ACP methyl ester carboxylesterase
MERGAAPGQVIASAATVGRPATIAASPAILVPRLLPITARPFTAAAAAQRPKPVLIYLHGLGESPLKPALPDLLSAAAADGYQVIFTDEGGPTTWGNRAAVAAVMALKAKYSPDRPVTLVGCSMGTLTLLSYVAAAAPGSVSAAVGLLPFSHLPTTEHLDTIVPSGATNPPQTINIPYQMWWGTKDLHAGPPTIHGPHVSSVPMVGLGHDIPIPYDLHEIFSFLDGYRAQ